MTDKEFENIYAQFVIKCSRFNGSYIMETNEARCALRSSAARFTKAEAIKFITTNPWDLHCEFRIEDAT